MKKLQIVSFWLLSFSAFADITPPPANYTMSGDVVIDANGEINDDPEQPVSLTGTEAPQVQSNLDAVNSNQEQNWIKRHEGCQLRADQNPALIK